MKTRILALLAAMVLLVCAGLVLTNAETTPDYTADLVLDADSKAECPACGEVVTWIPLKNEEQEVALTSVASDATCHYYVAEDVVTRTKVDEEGYFLHTFGKTCLHLNGNKLIMPSAVVVGSGSFNLMGSGTIAGAFQPASSASVDIQQCAATISNQSSAAVVNLYSGNIETVAGVNRSPLGYGYFNSGSGKIVIHKDAVVRGGITHSAGNITLNGGTVHGRIRMVTYEYASGKWSNPQFTMESGTVYGAGYGATSSAQYYSGNGGAFFMSNAKLTINGGTVYGGHVTGRGGAICTEKNINRIVMNGGTITGGYSHITSDWTGGGNIFIDYNNVTSSKAKTRPSLTMNGGTIKDGTAASCGGNIAGYGFEITVGTNAVISGGEANSTTASCGGGNIYIVKSSSPLRPQVNISGKVMDGDADSRGGNILCDNTDLTVNAGGQVSGGKAKDGGNIYLMNGCAANVYGATTAVNAGDTTGAVKDGVATTNGGNIYVAAGASLNVGSATQNGTVTGGVSAGGGSIYLAAGVTVNVYGTVSGGLSKGTGGNFTLSGGSHLKISGGTVSDGKAFSGGGNIQNNNGRITLEENGKILDGIANYKPADNSNTGNSGNGGNIACGAGTLTLKSGTISGGKALSAEGRGGNLYIYLINWEGNTYLNTTTIDGTQILDGQAGETAGNIWAEGQSALTMTDGLVKGGRSGNGQDNIRLNSLASMTMTGGTVYGTNGANAKGGTAINVNNSTLRLGGTAKVLREDGGKNGLINIVTTRGKLLILNDWTGEATTTTSGISYGGQLPEDEEDYNYTTPNAGSLFRAGAWNAGSFTKGGTYTGTLYSELEGNPTIYAVDGTMYISGAQLVKADGTAIWAGADPAAQYAAGDYAYLKQFGTKLTMNGDMVVDVNGKNMTVDGTGKFYGFDSANDTYDATKCGIVTVKGAVDVQPQVTVGNKRYVSLIDRTSNTATCHRLEITLKNVVLRLNATLNNVGYYYQAVYQFDDVLKNAIDSYGTVVSKQNMPGADFMDEPKGENGWTMITGELTSGVEVNSGLLKNIMQAEADATVNAANGTTKVYANPYIVINTSAEEATLIMSDTENAGQQKGIALSLKDVLVAVDNYWNEFTDPTVAPRMREFYNTWAGKGMSAWAAELPNMSGVTQ